MIVEEINICTHIKMHTCVDKIVIKSLDFMNTVGYNKYNVRVWNV